MKVFDFTKEDKPTNQPIVPKYEYTNEEDVIVTEKEESKLSIAYESYYEISSLHTTMVTMEGSYITASNIDLFNRYVNRVYSNLNIEPIETFTAEDFKSFSEKSINVLAMEGLGDFIKKIWEGIKAIVSKIVGAIKKFFKDYFTKEGIVLRKLNNIKDVLSKGKYTISSEALQNKSVSSYAASSVAKILATKRTINSAVVDSYVKSTDYPFMEELIKQANNFLVHPDVIKSFKQAIDKVEYLKKKKESINSEIDANKEKNADKGFLKRTKENITGKNEEAKNIKNLKNDLKDTEKEISNNKEIVDKGIVDTGDNLMDEEISGFIDVYKKAFNNIINANLNDKDFILAKGKKIVVKTDNNGDFSSVETEDAFSPESKPDFYPMEQNEIISFCSTMLDHIDKNKKTMKSFETLVANIDKSLTEQDKLFNSLSRGFDSIPEELKAQANKVKTQIDLFLKPFTAAFKSAVVTTSKLATNLYNNTLDIGNALATYATFSMKFYVKEST